MEKNQEQDRLWAALSYVVGIPALVILLSDMRERPFLRYHAIQALVGGFAVALLAVILSFVTLGLGAICAIPALFAILLYWAYQAYQGKWVRIPLVTNLLVNRGLIPHPEEGE